jgi:hypothetical protein
MQQESQGLWRGWEVGKDLDYGAACNEGVVQRSNGRNALETVTDLASQRSSALGPNCAAQSHFAGSSLAAIVQGVE